MPTFAISDKVYEEYHLSAGATLVMVHIFDDYMNFYSLGDSNIILIRNNRATILNQKQNYITLMIKKYAEGGIDTIDAYRDSRARGLIDFVGNHKCKVQMTSKPMRLIENDIIIVSSDGVTDSMPLNRIVSHIHADQNATGIARTIKYGVRASQILLHRMGFSLIRPQVYPSLEQPDDETREAFKKTD